MSNDRSAVIAVADDIKDWAKSIGRESLQKQPGERSFVSTAIGAMIDQCEIIAMDNVAAYLSRIGDDWLASENLKGMSITPPFGRVWAEWSIPTGGDVVGKTWTKLLQSGVSHAAVMIETYDLAAMYPDEYDNDPDVVRSLMRRSLQANVERNEKPDYSMIEDIDQIGGTIRFMCQVFGFIRWKAGYTNGPVSVNRFYLDPNGRLLRSRGGDHSAFFYLGGDVNDRVEFKVDNYASASWAMTYPALFGLSLMHLKNTTLDVVEVPEKLNRARVRRGHPEFVKYKVLTVEGGRTTRRESRTIVENGSDHKKSFHIVRGHHAEYGIDEETGEPFRHSDGRPKGLLFGKHSGRFWIPSGTRGALSSGTVVKDYDVKASRV